MNGSGRLLGSVSRRFVGLALGAVLVAGIAPVAGAQALTQGSVAVSGATAGVGSVVVDPVQGYIEHVYSDLFDRAPDPGGLAYWTAALANGTPRVAVANSITYSAEYRTGLITESYQHYLGRGPDASGLAFWLGQMGAGWTISQMESGFIASDEYYARAGSTPAGWVTKLYADVLGAPRARTRSRSGRGSWPVVCRVVRWRWGSCCRPSG